MFCCPGFENLIVCAGHKGISALVSRTSAGLVFLLQSRSVDADDENRLVPIPFDINLICNTGIRFCPFCGKPVQQMIEKEPEAFAQLATMHEKFQTVDR